MKHTLIQLSVLTMAMSLSTMMYADDSTIPTTKPGLAVSLTGMYLEPDANNLTYAIYTTPLPLPAPNWSQQTVEPGFSPAFDLGLQYTLADGNDQVNVDWLHLSTSNFNSIGPAASGDSIAPPYYFGPDAQSLVDSAANSTVQFNVDDVNLSFGHLANVTNHIQIEPFFSINTAELKEDINTNFTGKDGTANHYAYSITTTNDSQFTGIGPRIGLNGSYFVTNHLAVNAEFAASILAGSMQTNSTFYSYDARPGTNNNVTTTLADTTQTQLVPEVDSNIAVSYTIPFNTAGSNLNIAVGYLFEAYINGIHQVVPTALVNNAFNNGTIAIETEGQVNSDLTMNGPYLKLAYTF